MSHQPNRKPNHQRGRLAGLAALLAVLLLAAAACSSDTDEAGDNAPANGNDSDSTNSDSDNDANNNADNDADNSADRDANDSNGAANADADAALGDGSLGFVTVPAGESVQLRLVQLDQGALSAAGRTAITISQMALADYGNINGFEVEFGEPISDPCKPDAAEALAYEIVDDTQIVGVVGPTCSASSVAFSPVLSEAGLVVITSFSTTPVLTSDLAGNPGPDYYPGFYRTTPNDKLKAISIARFLCIAQELTSAAVLHTGNSFTQSLAEEFAAAFEELGGTITAIEQAVSPADVLSRATAIATADRIGTDRAGTSSRCTTTASLDQDSPQAVLLVLYPPSEIELLGQVAALPALANTLLITDGTVGKDIFNDQTVGMFFTLPDRYGSNLNQSTQVSTEDFLARYEQAFGEAPPLTTWAQAYDATTLLLDAVAAASYVNDAGDLIIDRQGIRLWLNQVEGYVGLSGPLECDDFGDCSSEGTLVAEQISTDIDAAFNNIVFEHFTRD